MLRQAIRSGRALVQMGSVLLEAASRQEIWVVLLVGREVGGEGGASYQAIWGTLSEG